MTSLPYTGIASLNTAVTSLPHIDTSTRNRTLASFICVHTSGLNTAVTLLPYIVTSSLNTAVTSWVLLSHTPNVSYKLVGSFKKLSPITLYSSIFRQDRQCTYHVTLRRVRVIFIPPWPCVQTDGRI